MHIESLVQLIGSGNTSTVEEEWMRVVEAPDVPLPKLVEYAPVLEELVRVDKREVAGAFAWTAIEAATALYGPKECLTIAGPFLLAAGESSELRAQVAELYRRAYEGLEGLEALLEEAGIAGGRPARRALRTLEVCLPLQEGDYLAARHDDGAARVDEIDRASWTFTINLGTGAETLGAVQLADAYRPADPGEFRVQRAFLREELRRRLDDDPAGVVIDICRQSDRKFDSDRLEQLLVPELLTEGDWKKWWPRARTALKRDPHVKVDGRAPIYITLLDTPVTAEEEFLAEFRKWRSPVKQLEVVESYVRDCGARQEGPTDETLRFVHEQFVERARRHAESDSPDAGLYWVIAARAGSLAGRPDAKDGAVALFRRASDLRGLFAMIEQDVLADVACECLIEAHPDDWSDRLLGLLPVLPQAACNQAAARLIEAGRSAAELDVAVQQILADPIGCFEALLWLWDGPTTPGIGTSVPPIAILTRLLRAMDDARVSDEARRETVTRMGGRARAVLAARKFERFDRCLEGLERDMVPPLKNRLKRSESLARAVREDLLKRLSARFPSLDVQPEIAPWSRHDVVFVTQNGLTRKKQEIDEHVNVRMRDNARAIGTAAEHGDLSENSEYKFALEERDLLRARLAQMNAEVAKAKVIAPEDVPTDHIGVGTRVLFRSVSNGQDVDMSFVGPWEADIANGLYNYQAPLAQRLMGKRVGDIVRLDHSGAEGEYEIVALHNALVH